MAKKKKKQYDGYFDARTGTFVNDAHIEENDNGWKIVKNKPLEQTINPPIAKTYTNQSNLKNTTNSNANNTMLTQTVGQPTNINTMSAAPTNNMADNLVKKLSKKTGYTEEEVTNFINDYNKGKWDNTNPKYRVAGDKFSSAGTEVYKAAKEYDKYRPTEKKLGKLENVAQSSVNSAVETGKGILDFAEGTSDTLLQMGSSKYNPGMWIATGETPWSKEQSKLDSYQNIAKEIIGADSSEKTLDVLGYNNVLSDGRTVHQTLDNGALIKSTNMGGKAFRSIGAQLPGLMTGSEAQSLALMGVNSFGSGVEEAYNNGGNRGQATGYGLLNSAIEVATEKIFAGVGGVIGKGEIDDAVINGINQKIKNELGQKLVSFGVKSLGEGTEEVIGDLLQPLAKKLTYASKEDLKKLYKDQNYLEDFILGSLSAAIMQGSTIPINNSSQNAIKDSLKGKVTTQNAIETFEQIKEQNEELSDWEAANIVNNALKETNQNTVNFSQNSNAEQQNTSGNINNTIEQNSSERLTEKEIKAIAEEVNNQQEKKPTQTVGVPKSDLKQYKNITDAVKDYANKVKSDFKTDIEIKTNKKIAPIDYKSQSQATIFQKAKSVFSKIGKSVFKNNGENIYVSNGDIKESIAKTVRNEQQKQLLSEHIEIFSNLDKIIENGNLIAKGDETKGRSQYNNWDYYVTPVKIDGKNYIVEFDTVLRDNKQKHFRLERIYSLDEIAKKRSISPTNDAKMTSNRTSETDGAFASNKQVAPTDKIDNQSVNRFVEQPVSNNNDTTKTKKSQIAPISSQYSMQQNEKNDTTKTKAPTKENNAIDEKSEKNQKKLTPRQEKTRKYREQAREYIENTIDWKDKGLFNQKLNTMKRNLRDIAGVKTGDVIYDEYFAPISKHNAEIERQITKYNDRIKSLKLTNKESTAVQMLGELKYNPQTTLKVKEVNNYIQKHKLDRNKIEKAVETFRKTYDELFAKVNNVLREQGYKEIDYRKGYFPHFNEEHGKTILGKFAEKLGWTFNSGNLPTDIAGLTDEFKPGKKWTSFSQKRTGDITEYNALKGFDNYVRGAMQVIYHTEDIQKLRALETEIRYQHSDKGLQEKLDKIFADDSLYEEEREDQIEYALKDYNNNLGNFVTNLRDYTNNLAGKKSVLDRSTEQLAGRKIYNTMDNITRRVSANMVGGNVASAFTNFIPITQAWSQISTKNLIKSMGNTIINSIQKSDNLQDRSDYLTSRTKQADRLFKTGLQKATDKAGLIFEAIDRFTSETIVRGKYYENLKKGMNETVALKNADEFAKDVMAGRSQGDAPTIFNSKSPIVKLFSAFQLEVNNQYGYMFKDLPTSVKDEGMGKLIFAFLKMFLGAWMYNKVAESITGRESAFSPIDIVGESFDIVTNDRLDSFAKGTKIAKNISEEIPFVGGLLGGGRIPISSALPDTEITFRSATNLFKGDKREKAIKDLSKELSKPLLYIALPFGGGQLKKTYEGLSMFSGDKEIKGSYTSAGKLRFPVANTTASKIKSALFGQYSSKEAKSYLDNSETALGEKQQKQYQALKVPISEYWEIKSNIKKIDAQLKNSGKSKDEREKVYYKYINSLDISDIKKAILKKSIYKSYHDKDYEIKKYINSSNMSKKSKEELLKELGLD